MGLTVGSTGKRAVDNEFTIERRQGECVIALAGNPNVGKSTVFNELTGLNQHTAIVRERQRKQKKVRGVRREPFRL